MLLAMVIFLILMIRTFSNYSIHIYDIFLLIKNSSNTYFNVTLTFIIARKVRSVFRRINFC